MGFFRKFAIKQVAGDHIYGISQVIAQCKRDMPQATKRQWAKAIAVARYDEPSSLSGFPLIEGVLNFV